MWAVLATATAEAAEQCKGPTMADLVREVNSLHTPGERTISGENDRVIKEFFLDIFKLLGCAWLSNVSDGFSESLLELCDNQVNSKRVFIRSKST